MKKLLSVIISIIVFSIALTGCEKEKILNTKSFSFNKLPEELQELYVKMPQRNYGNISVIDGNILCFATKEQYESVGNMLFEDCKIWDSLFCTAYSYLTNEQLTDLEEVIGYSEFIPLHLFEEQNGVSGSMLFDQQEILQQQWMENGLLGVDPTDEIFNLESDQAIHNIYHEVCVDDTIYQFRDDAIILVPIARLEEWRSYRNASTSDLENLFIVKANNNNNVNIHVFSNMPAHHNFICRDKDNCLSNNDFNVLGVKDKSVWSLVGRRGLIWSHVATYKLVNYEYVRTKNNGIDVFRKIRRPCSMIPRISFSTEQYEQLYQNFQNWYQFNGFLNEPLPSNKNVKTYSDKFQYQHQPINYLSNDYHFGIFTDSASVVIRIGGQSTTVPQTYNVLFQ